MQSVQTTDNGQMQHPNFLPYTISWTLDAERFLLKKNQFVAITIDAQTHQHYPSSIFPYKRQILLPERIKFLLKCNALWVYRQVSVAPQCTHTQNDLFILAWCCIHYSLKTQKTLNWWTQSFVHSSVQLLRKSWMRAALSSSCFQSTGSCWNTISSQLTSFTARMWWKLHTKKEEVL